MGTGSHICHIHAAICLQSEAQGKQAYVINKELVSEHDMRCMSNSVALAMALQQFHI